MAESSTDNTGQDLREYLVKVTDELVKREERLALMESEIAQLEFKLKETKSTRAISSGDISSVGAIVRYRAHLKEQVLRKKAAARELNEDVLKARQRHNDVLAEIKEQDGGASD